MSWKTFCLRKQWMFQSRKLLYNILQSILFSIKLRTCQKKIWWSLFQTTENVFILFNLTFKIYSRKKIIIENLQYCIDLYPDQINITIVYNIYNDILLYHHIKFVIPTWIYLVYKNCISFNIISHTHTKIS